MHLTVRAKKLLYYGQVHSHLCYCIGVWGPMLNRGQIQELKSIQNKCVRVINPTIPTKERLTKLNILSIDQLVELEQCKLGYKLCNQMLPTVLTKLTKQDLHNKDMTKTHTYPTRQKYIPHRPRVKLSLYMKSFLYQSIASFSNLPMELQRLPTLANFTHRVKKHLLLK